MALSGTLDTFALPDVLRLLASTNKTGRLRVTGDRGSGSLWTEDGQIIGTALTGPAWAEPTDAEVVWGLLRFETGSFTFEGDAKPATPSSPTSLEPVLQEAEALLVEWHLIEKVVPSLDAYVSLRPELTAGDVVVDADRWRTIVAIAGGASVGQAAEKLQVGEIQIGRSLKELVELDLIAVEEAPEPVDEPVTAIDYTVPSHDEPAFDDVATDESALHESALDEPAFDEPVFEAIGADESDVFDEPVTAEPLESMDDTDAPAFGGVDASIEDLRPVESLHDEPTAYDAFIPPADIEHSTEPSLASLGTEAESDVESILAGVTPDEVVEDEDELDPAEMARQLASLSPKAAKAVAAAAKASTAAEREAALALVEAEDETVNRGMLLKFLGSVDS